MTPQTAQSFGCFTDQCTWLHQDSLLPEINQNYSSSVVNAAGLFEEQRWMKGGKIVGGLGDHQCSVMAATSLDKTIFFNFGTSSQCSILTDKTIYITKPSVERI